MARSLLLQDLAKRIAEIEAQEHSCRLPETVSGFARAASFGGMSLWGDILPGRELAAGSLVELLSAEEGVGAWTLALFMARHVCGERKVLVVADGERRFYPPAASQLGVDLRRTIVVRPKERRQGLAAMTHSLRCPAVGAALGRLDRLSAADFRRLQAAVETGGGVGFLLRSAAAISMPSFATVRLLVAPVAVAPLPGDLRPPARLCLLRRVRVEVIRFRGSKAGQSLVLEIDDEKGHVCVPASVAAAKTVAREARASG